jgi:hypothetical protein
MTRSNLSTYRIVFTAVLLWTPLSALAASNANPTVHPPNSKPYGASYGEWSAQWWQWVLHIPAGVNPNLDTTGANCGQGQSGHVWFLGGTFGGSAVRTCNVPNGVSLLFPIQNTAFGAGLGDCLSPPPGNPLPCDVAVLRAGAAANQDNPQLLTANVDGVALQDLTAYRFQSPVFSFFLTADNLLTVLGLPDPAGTYAPAVSDG